MSPRVILYIGFAIAMFPLFAMYQYVSIIMAVSVETHDPKVLKGLMESMAMLGMFSWPVWLGLAGFCVLRWKFFNKLLIEIKIWTFQYTITIYISNLQVFESSHVEIFDVFNNVNISFSRIRFIH